MLILEYTLAIAASYGPLLIKGIDEGDLLSLVKKIDLIQDKGDRQKHKLGIDHYSKSEAIQNFADIITPYLSKEDLQSLINKLNSLKGEHADTIDVLVKALQTSMNKLPSPETKAPFQENEQNINYKVESLIISLASIREKFDDMYAINEALGSQRLKARNQITEFE